MSRCREQRQLVLCTLGSSEDDVFVSSFSDVRLVIWQVTNELARLKGDDLEKNLPNAMRGIGYRTGAAGKWQLQSRFGGKYDDLQSDVKSAGFDWADGLYPQTVDADGERGAPLAKLDEASIRALASLCSVLLRGQSVSCLYSTETPPWILCISYE